TSRGVDIRSEPWLSEPIGEGHEIGSEYFHNLARQLGLVVRDGAGLVASVHALASTSFYPRQVSPAVRHFYEHTSEYALDVWSDWSAAFRPFGLLLARLFSRRLQQLNLPLRPLDTSGGLRSDILELANCD